MHIHTHVRRLLIAVLTVAPLAAQAFPTVEVPPPTWQAWVQGDPVVIGGEPAPKCTVFTFCTRRPAAFHDQADYLRALQQRFGERGLAVVAVLADVPEERAELERLWAGCRVVVDAAGATTADWLGPEGVAWNTLVLDRGGKVTFLGTAEAGLVDAIDRTLAGAPAMDRERTAFSCRAEALIGFDDLDAARLVQDLESVIDHAPHDGIAHGLLYAAQVQKLLAPAAAKTVRTRAIEVLRDDPRPLAAFADLALRCDPRGEGLADELVVPLTAAAQQAPDDTFVRLAHLRALVLAGRGRGVGRAAMTMQKQVLRAADHCLDFASILAADRDALVHRDLAQRVLDRAEQLGATPRFLTAARYGAAVRCQEDPAAAKKLMDTYLADNGDNLNNDCWYLMTELPTMGRYDWFAAGLAERMLEQRDTMQDYQFDTAALALFLVGRVGEAVELQQKAIALGGTSHDYQQRLRRYEAAVPTPPR